MLSYSKGTGEYENWILAEEDFDLRYQNKCESIMALGNGYLGLRSSFEEPYVGQIRNMFVAGTYNKADVNEVTELPNAADVVEMQIYLNSELFSLTYGKILEYSRYLNLKDGELVREVLWESPKGLRYRLLFRRFVSLGDLHFIGIKVSITPIDEDAIVKIKTGINGKMTNSGVQHFKDGEKRVYEKEYLQLIQTTTESNIDFVINCCCSCYLENKMNRIFYIRKDFFLERRSIFGLYEFKAKKNLTINFEKFANVFTSRDKEYAEKYNLQEMRHDSLEHLKICSLSSYDELFEKSKSKWRQYWKDVEVRVESKNSVDQLALRFAQYHLLIMTPMHDERFSVGAKGLTGEGYKGHVFWDTELFILPYFQYNMPNIAGQLLKYRYLTLEGARKKAKQYGYEGAMYPWESAYTGEEETPEWAAINIITGEPTRVWSGIKEHHITADIAYAVWNYYLSTDDVDFLKKYGSEIIFECAWFWCSRAKWNSNKSRYEILDVIGPDEYTEHVDNNAYTNYMAHYVISIALRLYDLLPEIDREAFEFLDRKLNLKKRYDTYLDVYNKLYLPKPNENGIIPQDDTFLSKKQIDIDKYRNSEAKQSILLDYSRDQVVNMQVLKQADVVMLLYVLKNLFDKEVIEKNWKYYEARTIHDSSLSMAIHSIVATFFDDIQAAYECFKQASMIDMGQNPNSSDNGIHAASMGGIWLAAVIGFGGVFNNEGILELNPALPYEWEGLEFDIKLKLRKIHISIDRDKIEITSKDDGITDIMVYGEKYILEKRLVLPYRKESQQGCSPDVKAEDYLS